MKTQGYNIQPDNHFNLKQNEVWAERKIQAMEEEIEVLREQVESLKREQQFGYELLHECLQELEYTNKEVELMNEEIFNFINLKTPPSKQAKPWAKNIAEKNASISESPSELVNAIDGYPINIKTSENIEAPIFGSKVEQFNIQSREIRAKSEQIINRSRKITARSHEIRVCYNEVKARSREIRNQLNNDKVSCTASKILNLFDAITLKGDRVQEG